VKILIEKRTVDALIPATVGTNTRRLESACLGREVEVDKRDYRRWRTAVDNWERVQREMLEVVG